MQSIHYIRDTMDYDWNKDDWDRDTNNSTARVADGTKERVFNTGLNDYGDNFNILVNKLVDAFQQQQERIEELEQMIDEA